MQLCDFPSTRYIAFIHLYQPKLHENFVNIAFITKWALFRVRIVAWYNTNWLVLFTRKMTIQHFSIVFQIYV